MRYAPRALLAGGLGFAVAFLVACGGGAGLLSADHASSLNNQLDRVSAAVESGQCASASSAASSLTAGVQALPRSVNAKLRRNLAQGAATVADLARQDCRAKPAKPHTTSTQTQSTQTKTKTTTTPTNTNTTPTQTQPQTNPATNPNTSTQPPVTNPSGPGTTSTGSSGGAGFGGDGASGGTGSGGNGQ